jgi:hypothetical protein
VGVGPATGETGFTSVNLDFQFCHVGRFEGFIGPHSPPFSGPRIPHSVPMDSGGWHPRRSSPTGYGSGLPVCKGYKWNDAPPLAGLPLRYRKYLRSNQVSLPDFRKLSDPHPTAMPLTGFAHRRTEKIRAKNRCKKWTSWQAIPRPCSAMALPWPSGRVDNEARIQPGRTPAVAQRYTSAVQPASNSLSPAVPT